MSNIHICRLFIHVSTRYPFSCGACRGWSRKDSWTVRGLGDWEESTLFRGVRSRTQRCLIDGGAFVLRGCVQTCPGIAYFPVRHSSSGRNPASSTHQPGGDIWAPAFAGAANTPPHGPLVFLTQTLSSTLYVRAALVPGRCKYSCRIFTTSFLAGDIQKMLTETLGMRLPCTLITHDYANFGQSPANVRPKKRIRPKSNR